MPWAQAREIAEQLVGRAIDSASAFRDTEGKALERQWHNEVAAAKQPAHRATVRRQSSLSGGTFVLAMALLALLVGLESVAVALAVIGAFLVMRGALTRVPPPSALPAAPAVLPSVGRSSAAYLPLTQTVAARGAMRALLPHVEPGLAELARETGVEIEQAVASLARSIDDIERAGKVDTTVPQSRAMRRLRTDLDTAVAAYRDLTATVDEAAATRQDERIDELQARVAGIKAAVAALALEPPA